MSAKKKDEAALAYRSHVLEVANKAPMSPPWWTFWMEFTYSATKQRVGVLLRYDKAFANWVGTIGFDRYQRPGDYEYIVNAFELLLDPITEMYGSTKFNMTFSDVHRRHVIPALAEVATVFIQLKNYYKKQNGIITPLVGQQTSHPPAAAVAQPAMLVRLRLEMEALPRQGKLGQTACAPGEAQSRNDPAARSLHAADQADDQRPQQWQRHARLAEAALAQRRLAKLHNAESAWRCHRVANRETQEADDGQELRSHLLRPH